VCDDLQITVDGGRIVQATGACAIAEPWFLAQGNCRPEIAEIDGQPAEFEAALAHATAILSQARAPLVSGSFHNAIAGHRAALALADELGATIDTLAAPLYAHTTLALQQAGQQTCTLGEVKNRADLVIFWGIDPVVSHPRHLERYSVDATGEFIAGRKDRTVVVVAIAPNKTAAKADLFLPLDSKTSFEALWALRWLVRGEALPEDSAETLPVDLLADLARRMRDCRFGVVFFGPGLSAGPLGHHTVEALFRLVGELNDCTRFYAAEMAAGPASGVATVTTWQTGYPPGVDLGAGFPRYYPGEFTTEGLLERQDVDACLLVGVEGLPRLSATAFQYLLNIPTIALDVPLVKMAVAPTVRFTTAVDGVHRAGTTFRMDGVPIPLKGVLPGPYPGIEDVLSRLLEALRQPAKS
jgi:formylmethanofuran dehydrogenase subunit B